MRAVARKAACPFGAQARHRCRYPSRVVRQFNATDQTVPAEFSTASLARLVDTNRRAEVVQALRDDDVDDAYSRYARAYLELARGDTEEAIRGFVAAQAVLAPGSDRLAARLTLELGFVFISRGRLQTAEAILEWGTGVAGSDAADVAHLRALLADCRGDYRTARAEYRLAIRRAPGALSTTTYALALTNLAVALAHENPQEAVELAELSLKTISAADLFGGIRPAVENTLGYSQIALGNIREAVVTLRDAFRHAESYGNERVALCAMFNLAIVDEMSGEIGEAVAKLSVIAERCREEISDLHAWCVLRLRWLGTLSNEPFTRVSTPLAGETMGPALAAGYLQLEAVEAALSGRLSHARQRLRSQREAWQARGDSMNEFVTLLWLAVVERRSSRDMVAMRVLREARVVSERSGLRLATSWWHPALLETATAIGEAGDRKWAETLRAVPGRSRSATRSVRLQCDGSAFIDGIAVPQEIWREGRTGSRVLRRYFRLLLERPLQAWARDDLADALWPDSDGDRAVKNLHAATHDLRRVLADIPGTRLNVVEGTYALQLANSVAVEL